MKYKKLLQHLTSPFAYRPARIIQLLQYKADPQQNKVRVSMPMDLSFFLFSMLVTLLSSVIVIIVCSGVRIACLNLFISFGYMIDVSLIGFC